MSQTVSNQASTMRQCSSCGSSNADEAAFCSTCGATFPETQPSRPSEIGGGTTKPVPIVKTITPLARAPAQFPAPMAVPGSQAAVGFCFYHPELPATYICVRCGRTICFSCTKPYGQLAMCPQCYWVLARRGVARTQPPSR